MSVLKYWKDLQLTRYHVIMIYGLSVVMNFIRLANVHFPLYANVTPWWACNYDQVGARFNTTDNILDTPTARQLNSRVNLSYSQNCSIYYACQSQNGSLLFKSPYFSARQEFNLVCDRAYQASLVSSVQFVGELIGSNLFGRISDRLGRKKVLSVLIIVEAGFGFSSSFAFGPISLAFLRFFTGICTGGILSVLSVFMLEALQPKQRVFMRAFASVPTFKIFLVPLWYVKPNWRFFLRITNIIQIPTLLLLVFAIPESVKWATDRNKNNLAIKSQKQIDWINGKNKKAALEHPNEEPNLSSHNQNLLLPPGQTEDNPLKIHGLIGIQDSSPKNKGGLRTLFVSKELRGATVALCSMWMAISVTACVIRFDSRNLAGDFYLNQVWLGLAGMFSSIVLLILDTVFQGRIRRRILYQIPQLAMIIFSSIAIACLAAGGRGSFGFVVTVSAVAMSFFLKFVYDSTTLSTGEVFPTEIRASAFGMCSSLSTISTVLTPEIVLFRQTWAPGPYLVVAALGVLALVLSYLYQPETRGKQLPATMKHASEAANLKH